MSGAGEETGRDRSPLRALRRLRYNPFVSGVLYGAGKPVHSLAGAVHRGIARKVRLNGGETVYDGIRLRFPSNVGPDQLSNIAWYGEDGYEPHTWRVLRACLEGAGTFLDIGANIGFYSVLAHRIAPDAKKISFEPVPNLQAAARRFFAANGVPDSVCPVALSDRDGTATLYQPAGDHDFGESAANTLVADSWQARKEHVERTVDVVRLDRFLSGQVLKRPVVAKIDVEDHEAAVLRGAGNTIGTYRPLIVCEILPRLHGNRDTIDILDRLDYAPFAITAEGCFRFGRNDFARERFFTDFLLAPKEKVDPSAYFIPHGSRLLREMA